LDGSWRDEMHRKPRRTRWAVAGIAIRLIFSSSHLGPFAAQGTGSRVSGAFTVTTVAEGLDHPWSLAFLPDGNMLVTERAGRLRVIRNGTLLPEPVAGVPDVYAAGWTGLLEVLLHPKFSENRFVYLSYSKPGPPFPAGTVPMRSRLLSLVLSAIRLEGSR
jgi:glucose/arabinose dehydrogenase